MIRQAMLVVVAVLGTVAWAGADGTKIVIEAETYSSIQKSMEKASSTTASAGAYIQVPLRRPHGEEEGAPADTGRAAYKIRVTAAGYYYFWALCNWYDGCGNSFFVKIGDKPAAVVGQDGTYQLWHWVRGPAMQLGAGTYTVIVQYREDGAKMDQFMLVTDRRVIPVGKQTATPGYLVH